MQQNTASSRGSGLRSASPMLCRLLCVLELVMEGVSKQIAVHVLVAAQCIKQQEQE
jgi:hypothetical protein